MSRAIPSNFAALQAIASSMQSLLGPNKSLKCCVGDAGSSILGDAMQVLAALLEGNEHPMVQLLYELCRAQWERYGSGVTTIVCLAAFWSEEITPLLHCGVPVPVIESVFSEVMEVCSGVFEATAIELQAFAAVKQEDHVPTLSQSHFRALSFSRHFQPARRTSEDLVADGLLSVAPCLAHGRVKAGSLAVSAARLQQQTSDSKGCSFFDPSFILQHRIMGMGQEFCVVVSGVVFPLDATMVAMAASLPRSLNIFVVIGDMTPSALHPGLHKRDHVTSHDPKQLIESSDANKWLQKCKSIIEELKVGAIFSSGSASPLLWDHCLGNNIVMVTNVRSAQLRVLCQMSKAKPISLLTHASERHVGRWVQLETMEGFRSSSGKERQKRTNICRVTCPRPSVGVVTAVLCGRSFSSLELLSQQFTHCLRVMQCVCEDVRVVRGGGWTEAACVAEIETTIRTNSFRANLLPMKTSWMNHVLSLWKPRVYQAFADGLRHYIRVVLINTNVGMGPYEAKTRTEKMIKTHHPDEATVKVYDAMSSKRECWLKALEAIKLALLSNQQQPIIET